MPEKGGYGCRRGWGRFGNYVAARDEGEMERGEDYCQSETSGGLPFGGCSARLHSEDAAMQQLNSICLRQKWRFERAVGEVEVLSRRCGGCDWFHRQNGRSRERRRRAGDPSSRLFALHSIPLALAYISTANAMHE